MMRVELVTYDKQNGIVEAYARVWDGDEQLGFGDGSVDIERFRFINPKWHDEESLLSEIKHAARLVGKRGATIVEGKRGRTTDTFYPSSDDAIFANNATFATARAASTGTARSATVPEQLWVNCRLTGGSYFVERTFVNFDTAALPDGATISAAVFSLNGDTKLGSPTSHAYNVYGSTASDTIVANDFDLVGSTAYCDASITHANVSTSAFNDFTLNATGIAAIVKTGITKFSVREVAYDVGNTAPPNADVHTYFDSVDVTGTSSDPKLVITYTVMAGTSTITGAMTAVLSANQYPVFASNVPRTTFRTRA